MAITNTQLEERVKDRFWESGWCPKLHRPKRFILGTNSSIAKEIGLGRRTCGRRLWRGKMGYYKALARQGMCDYCVCFRRYEVPVTESIVLELQRRLELQGDSDFWTQWLDHTARDAAFKAANFQRAGNPRYWQELFQFMDG